MVRFSDGAVRAWEAEPRRTRDDRPTDSALAVLAAPIPCAVFGLAPRQPEDPIASILRLLGLDLGVLDQTTSAAG